ncbi:discoidin domain-containing protein [Streptomyces peucetius]|uniref:Discoidin domain-containing protein n=1 Tax=Streptomyces peucetius TaxID=1950 RepID=A0ABY6I653_STRPE|nr:discoidin domain-containing protein [Streptomyces peucetius]UYQ62476.1 discoidin domain-containing protein [Streptomyces peucetius]
MTSRRTKDGHETRRSPHVPAHPRHRRICDHRSCWTGRRRAGSDYDLQVSDAGVRWRTVAKRRGRTTAGVHTVELLQAVTARHVRMRGLKRQNGYSLYRFEVRA